MTARKHKEQGSQGPSDGAPPKPAGWRSAWELSREYVGFCGTIGQKLEGLRSALLGDVVAAGYSAAEAAALVDDHLIGRRKSRQGPECLAASPAAVRLLGLTKRNEAVPAKAEGWRSGRELRKEYVGGSIAINKRMAVIRQALLGDMVAAGYSATEASALLDDHLIGRKRPKQGRECLEASPEAVRMLGLRRKSEAAPEKPNGWRSGEELSQEYVGGSIAINKRMAMLRRTLLGDMVGAGHSESEAAALIDAHLIGRKKPAQGREGLAASPEAMRLAEELGFLNRRRTAGQGCRGR